MFCKFCGNQIPDGSVFCQKCGKRLTAAAENEPPKAGGSSKKLSKKALLAIIIGAAAILIAVITTIVSVSLSRKNNSNYIVRSGETGVSEIDDDLIIINRDGQVTSIEYPKDVLLYSSEKYDLTRSKMAFITVLSRSGDSILGTRTYDLYYYDGHAAKKILDGVEERPYFAISSDGSTVAYSHDKALYVYSNGTSKKIAEGNLQITAISPDGGTVAYCETSDDGVMKGYYYNGKNVFLVNSGYAFAIANGAKYVYICREAASGSGESTYYVQKKDNESTRIKICSSGNTSEVILNSDLSQALLLGNKVSYYSKNAGEPVKVCESSLGIIGANGFAFYYDGSLSYIVGIKDFEKAVYLIGDKEEDVFNFVYLSGGKPETILTVDDDCVDFDISPDGKTLFFEDDEKLYYYPIGAKKTDPIALAELEDIWNYKISQDGKIIYYCNNYFEVYAQKLGGKAVKIFDGSRETASSITVCNSAIYFLNEGKLYVSNGGKAREIKVSDSRLTKLASGNYLLIAVDENGNSYLSSDGITFKKVSDKNWLDY
ncbi:MAG: zinc-ribbon domain-containing protein [Clostridia bacterium]|nr:zinc-ribbon domain-containing protein [Clostridia bacterium]